MCDLLTYGRSGAQTSFCPEKAANTNIRYMFIKTKCNYNLPVQIKLCQNAKYMVHTSDDNS